LTLDSIIKLLSHVFFSIQVQSGSLGCDRLPLDLSQVLFGLFFVRVMPNHVTQIGLPDVRARLLIDETLGPLFFGKPLQPVQRKLIFGRWRTNLIDANRALRLLPQESAVIVLLKLVVVREDLCS
jgi:hypothetical protein